MLDYRRRVRRYACPGSPVKQEYQGVYDSSGHLTVQESGVLDLDAFINSFASECDLSVIMARYMSGDTSVLNRRQCFYGDVTSLPHDLHSALESLDSVKALFESFPDDFKAQFTGVSDWLKHYVSDPSAALPSTPELTPEPSSEPTPESSGGASE